MKCLNRNRVKFYYALYDKSIPVIDDYGNQTGEYVVKYSNPVEGKANISAVKGETQSRQFGENELYDKVIVLDNGGPLIDEYSLLWVDIEPELNADGSLSIDDKGEVITPHDYIVKKVARSLNYILIAISKVNVT